MGNRFGPSRAGLLAGRSGIFVGIVATHACALFAFAHAAARSDQRAAERPVEVVFIEQQALEQAPPAIPPELATVRPPDIVLPVIDLPADPAPSQSITVVPPKAEVRSTALASNADVPLLVHSVDYMRPPAPRYPPTAKRARVQGTVLLRVLIDPQGRPAEVRVHRSSGSEQLDVAACDSVRDALFHPHRENGVARSAQVIIPVEFSLRDPGGRRHRRGDHEDHGGGRGDGEHHELAPAESHTTLAGKSFE